ncbi:hypothetical protein [Lewinella cohaerens]|uniref:hypothetical protein n=1 Tax=Lewinella cohaerens TaxID=70995 RepID=UPI0003789361|nr:hypothetical protein [Lewinella cohaerens]
MANLKLGSSDIKQLLANFASRQRQLQFELDHTRNMIKKLKSTLPAIEQIEAEQAALLAEVEAELEVVNTPAPVAKSGTKRRGRPARGKTKEAPVKPTPKAGGKKTKKERSSGYRLSEYDELVFKALRETGHAMINTQIVAFIEADKAAQGENPGTDEVQKMVVRSLQKLANRRDDIKKTPYEGRGIAYALPEWLNGKGVIKKKHAHKE